MSTADHPEKSPRLLLPSYPFYPQVQDRYALAKRPRLSDAPQDLGRATAASSAASRGEKMPGDPHSYGAYFWARANSGKVGPPEDLVGDDEDDLDDHMTAARFYAKSAVASSAKVSNYFCCLEAFTDIFYGGEAFNLKRERSGLAQH